MNDPRWTPVRKGRTYCSPACGCKCTVSAFEKATKDAAALAARMGEGWEPRVWENCGWHWTVFRGNRTAEAYVEVYPNHGGADRWWIDSRVPNQFHLTYTGKDPREGVKQLMAQVSSYSAKMKRILEELS